MVFPAAFVATSRSAYLVLGRNLVMVAVTALPVLPAAMLRLRVCLVSLCPRRPQTK